MARAFNESNCRTFKYSTSAFGYWPALKYLSARCMCLARRVLAEQPATRQTNRPAAMVVKKARVNLRMLKRSLRDALLWPARSLLPLPISWLPPPSPPRHAVASSHWVGREVSGWRKRQRWAERRRLAALHLAVSMLQLAEV